MADSNEGQSHYWSTLGSELWTRVVTPWKHPSFLIFFVVAIIGLAPLGTWLELYDYVMDSSGNLTKLRASVISFVPAFVAATAMQLIWAEAQRMLRALGILLAAICGISLFLCGSTKIGDIYAMVWGGISALIALFMWWITNANQREFHDSDPQYLNAVGGEINSGRALAGSLNGFETE